ncbi:hypothetical protein [Mangrovibacterium lignilyticum]|uniref:hypothetical protein n=1 Tax=Mangrovibacterium lignilyticum TaxID=2668052 RepID=UPI0013D38056|nr:hypothetical protein [Mangrovibacterium lignilyticum]
MKSKSVIILLFAGLLSFSSCKTIFVGKNQTVKTNANGDIPPGQMKKLTGKKSAKKYAPGQTKKN